MEKVLVTGAGGYIGCILVPMLLEKGYSVRALDRYFFGRDLLKEHENLEIVVEDIRRIKLEYFADVDHVVDLAALSNDPSGELFQNSTWGINHVARVNIANMAKQLGVKKYILPSSCSIYGFQEEGVIANEESPTNPLTTYAKANEKAEHGTLPLSDKNFTVVALRQATVYGYSPRMRFDLAINGMTYGAWNEGVLPLMRDGSQWRPMVHVRDTARAMCFMLQADSEKISGQVFNVGSDDNNYQLKPLAEKVASTVPRDVQIEWYGDPDHRSYRVSFSKIESLGFKAKYVAEDGVREICQALEEGKLEKTTETITLKWYQELVKWHQIIKNVEKYGGIIEI
jgi:nucleoside-diphosphate-sugar epimerase